MHKRQPLRFVQFLWVFLLLVFSSACHLSAYDIHQDNPEIPIIKLCDKPIGTKNGVRFIALDRTTGKTVTDEDAPFFRNFVWGSADVVFDVTDPEAPEENLRYTPHDWGLKCVKPSRSLPDPISILPDAILPDACPNKVTETNDRPDPRFIGQTTKPSNPIAAPKKKKDPLYIHVCVRPSWVGPTVDQWAVFNDAKGNRLTEDARTFVEAAATADSVFIFDESAPPESVYWFVKDPTKLSCPGKPIPKPYEQVVGCGMLPMLAAATSMTTALSGNPKKGDGQTTWTSSPDGKGPPLAFYEAVLRQLAITSAITSGDTHGSLKDPDGSRHGIPQGKNVGGPNSAILQGVVATYAILGNPVKNAKDLVKYVGEALGKKEVLIIKDVKLFPKDVAEKIAEEPKTPLTPENVDQAESFGASMGPSLEEVGTIMPYSRAQIFTKGWGGKFQAHHIFEVERMNELGLRDMTADAPAVVLTEAEHQAITNKLDKAYKKVLEEVKTAGGKEGQLPSKERIWAMYQEVYKDYPNWLKAIEHYF